MRGAHWGWGRYPGGSREALSNVGRRATRSDRSRGKLKGGCGGEASCRGQGGRVARPPGGSGEGEQSEPDAESSGPVTNF